MNDDELNEFDGDEEVYDESPELDDENPDLDESSGEYDTSNLPEGIGRGQFAKTVGDRNYYKDRAGELRSNLEKARAERANPLKEVPNKDNANAVNRNSAGEKTPQKSESGNKATPTTVKKKGALDKASDTLNVLKAKKDIAENKINSAQAKAYQVSHPIQATKERAKAEAKSRIKKKVRAVVISHLPLFLLIALFALIFLILLLIFLGGSDGNGDENENYIEDDFNTAVVQVTNNYNNTDDMQTFYNVDLSSYAMGAAFLEFKDSMEGLTENQKSELYKSYILVVKSKVLVLGGYDSEEGTLLIKSSQDGIPYCSVVTGCSVFENDGKYTYAPYNYSEGDLPGIFVGKIEPMSDEELEILSNAEKDVHDLLLVPDSINSVIVKGDYTAPPYSQSIKNGWINNVKNNKDYRDLIADTSEYTGYKIYDHTEYATEYSYATSTSYWWPVGSAEPDSDGLYSGTPVSLTITSPFGPRVIEGVSSNHGGIDISGGGLECTSRPIIASRSGTVTTASDGCATYGSYGNTCNGGSGNYVMIDHGDTTMTVYAHMAKNSIVVKAGDHVTQGQLIGYMGSSGSSTGCHLHFEVRVLGIQNNPSDYVSTDNPRPAEISFGFEEGANVQQTVCRSLLASNFSKNGAAAILANMAAESGFIIDNIGDNGTSYGLCQWNNSRWTDLKNYCNSNGLDWHSVEGQYEFFLSEFNGYPNLISYFNSTNSARDMADYFCQVFERPLNASYNCPIRADDYTATYEAYVANGCN